MDTEDNYDRLFDEDEKKSHVSLKPEQVTSTPPVVSSPHSIGYYSFPLILVNTLFQGILRILLFPINIPLRALSRSPFLLYHSLHYLGILMEYSIGLIFLFLIWEIIQNFTIQLYATGDLSLEVIDEIIVSFYYTYTFALLGIITILLPLLASRDDYTLIVRILAFLISCVLIVREDEFLAVSPFSESWKLYASYIACYVVPSTLFGISGAIGSWKAIPNGKVKILTPVVSGSQLIMLNYCAGPSMSCCYQALQLFLNDDTFVPYRTRWPQEFYEDKSYGLWRPYAWKNYLVSVCLSIVMICSAAFSCRYTTRKLPILKFFQSLKLGVRKVLQLSFVQTCGLYLCPFNMFYESDPISAFYFALVFTLLSVTLCALTALQYENKMNKTDKPVAERVTNRTKFFVDFFANASGLCVAMSFWRAVDLLVDHNTPLPSLQQSLPDVTRRLKLKIFGYPVAVIILFWIAKLFRRRRREIVKVLPVFEIIEEELNLNSNLEEVISDLSLLSECGQKDVLELS